MAQKNLDVGVKYTGDNKDFKQANAEARKEAARLRKEAVEHSREMERRFKNVSMAMIKIGTAVVVAKKAFEAYGKIMQSTGGTADAFEITMGKVRGSIAEIGRSVATGDFKGLADRMKQAAEYGAALADQLDYVFDLSLRLKLVTADTELAMARQQRIYKDKRNPYEVRYKAAEEYLRLVRVLEEEQLAFAREEVKAATLQGGIAMSGLPEERLRWYVDNAKLLKENEEAVKAYLQAQKDLNAELSKPKVSTVAASFGGGIVSAPVIDTSKIDELREKIEGASDTVKEFAKDYELWQLSQDPERQGLIDAWAKLSTVMKDAEVSATKPLRTINSLLNEENAALDDNKRKIEDVATAWNSLVYPERQGQIAMPQISGVASLIPEDYTDEIRAANEELMRMSEIADDIAATFETLISAGIKGWDEFGEAAMRAIQNMIIKLAAMGALYAALSLIPGFAEFMEFVGKVSDFANGKFLPSMINENKSMTLKGRDIAMAGNRSMNTILINT